RLQTEYCTMLLLFQSADGILDFKVTGVQTCALPFLTALILLLSLRTHSQTVAKRAIDMESFIEELFAMQEDELDYEELYEGLLQLYLTPLDLNRASAEELQSLYILNPLQINEFMDYRRKYGHLLTLYELQAVPEFR